MIKMHYCGAQKPGAIIISERFVTEYSRMTANCGAMHTKKSHMITKHGTMYMKIAALRPQAVRCTQYEIRSARIRVDCMVFDLYDAYRKS